MENPLVCTTIEQVVILNVGRQQQSSQEISVNESDGQTSSLFLQKGLTHRWGVYNHVKVEVH